MIVKKALCAVLFFGLLACSGGQPNKTFYQLPAAAESLAKLSTAEKDGFIWIESLNVADFLDDQGIAYQTSDVSFVNAKSHLWLTPLSLQLKNQLIQQLSEAMPSKLVSAKRMTKPSYAISVNVNGFHGRFDGTVILDGEWIIQNAKTGKFVTKTFRQEVDLSDDGYDVLVKTLATAWHEEVNELVHLIEKNK